LLLSLLLLPLLLGSLKTTKIYNKINPGKPFCDWELLQLRKSRKGCGLGGVCISHEIYNIYK